MDEAHNARTQLSFETLARFSPSCVVEFTATPAIRHAPEAGYIGSNVLAHVSAAELKAEEMIKLPVKLWTQSTWTDAVTDALAKQRELEEIAVREQAATGERIRPIVLFQAQANRASQESVTPAALKQALIDDHHVPAEQIAIETGSTRELEGVDLSAPSCPIRFVITVQALREGWDCPTAYVLCSIAEQAAPRAVEQLLGRVLRLPGARRKQEPEMNLAYAFVVSPSFAAAAQGLRDALVEAGFERLETETLIEEGRSEHPSLFYATSTAPVQRIVSEPPRPDAFEALEPAVRDAVRFDPATMTVTVSAPLTDDAGEQLAECFTTPETRAAIRTLSRESRQGPTQREAVPIPAQRALVVPQLAIRTDRGLELFEETHFLEAPWRLADLDPGLSDAEFPLRTQGGQEGVVDVGAQGRIEISFHNAVSNQLSLLEGEPGWTTASLAVWLDAHIPHPDLTQSDARLFVHRVLEALIARSGALVDQLAQEKYRLRKALEAKIERHRTAQHVQAFQQSLFGDGAIVEVVPEIALRMEDPSRYSPNWLYEGGYRFRKHLFPLVGELKDSGEEQDCAIRIDEHPLVATWVRNISNRPQESFWLQTSADRFYPDFVGELTDGRIFAVEYKGVDRWSDDDSREKRAIGDLWAASSSGRCVFLMPKGPEWGAPTQRYVQERWRLRMKARVFVSSVVDGFESFREAARAGIAAAGGEPVLVNEDLPSLTLSSRNACLDAVDSADVVLSIIGERGGWVAPSGMLVVEEEYEHAVSRKRPVLVFIREGPHDPDATRFAQRLSDYVEGTFRRTFTTEEDLRTEVERALRPLLVASPIPADMTRPSRDHLATPHAIQGTTMLRFVLTPERDEEVIDPVRLASDAFRRRMYELGHGAEVSLLSYERPKTASLDGDDLVILQTEAHGRHGEGEHVRLQLSENGELVIDANVSGRVQRGDRFMGLTNMVLAIDDVEAVMRLCFGFAAALYDELDPHKRHMGFGFNVALSGLDYRTLERNPQPRTSYGVSMRDRGVVRAYDVSRRLSRNDLYAPAGEIERAVTLLARRADG